MRRAIGHSLRIDASASAVRLQRISRWRGDPLTLIAEQAIAPSAEHPFDAIANALRALLGEQEFGGWPASVVLGDELTRMWRVTPPPGAARLADIEGAAGLRFQALYGEAPSAWQVSADWSTTGPFFAAAVPRALLALLQLVAEEFKLTIVAMEPQFVAHWNRWRRGVKQGAWFGIVHENLLTLGAVESDGRGMRAVRVLPVPNGADHYWLTQTLKREALLLDMGAPQLLQVCGAAPEAWTRPAANAEYIACTALDGSTG
jgi:hypothetical protein